MFICNFVLLLRLWGPADPDNSQQSKELFQDNHSINCNKLLHDWIQTHGKHLFIFYNKCFPSGYTRFPQDCEVGKAGFEIENYEHAETGPGKNV